MVYKIIKGILKPLLYLIYKPRIIGLENLPREGRTIVYANHISMKDPVVIGCILPRRIYFMAKEELFKNPVMRWLMLKLGAFPVKRGSADIAAVKNALKVLKEEKVFGIFPEGTRNTSGEIIEFAHGIASIAHKSKAVTVPIVILDNYKAFHSLRIVIGEPLDLSQYYEMKSNIAILGEISEKMADATRKLIEKYSINK